MTTQRAAELTAAADPIRAGLANGACRRRFTRLPQRRPGIDELLIGADVLVDSDAPVLGEWSLVVYDLVDDLDHRLEVPGEAWAAFVGSDFHLVLAELNRHAYVSVDVVVQVLLETGYVEIRSETRSAVGSAATSGLPDAIPAVALQPPGGTAGMVHPAPNLQPVGNTITNPAIHVVRDDEQRA